MVFPTGWDRKCSLVIQASGIDSDLTDFPVLLTEDTLPLEMFDADGSYPALNGGGDIRFSFDEDGSTQVACEVVNFTTDNDPNNGKAEIWVKVPTISSGVDTTFYVWYNKADETQPASSGTYGSENVWDTNFKMVQHMEDATTSSITDSTSNSNNGTKKAANEPIEINGKIGKEQDFDGSDDYLDMGDVLSNLLSGNMTIEAYINGDDYSSSNAIIDRADYISGPGGKGWNFYVTDDGDLAFRIGVSGDTWLGYGWTIYTADTNFVSSQRYHVVIVREGTTGAGGTTSFKMYVDGTDCSISITGGNNVGECTTKPLLIGRYGPATYGNEVMYFDGTIDEVRISNTSRSAYWILACFNNQNDPSAFVVAGTPEYVSFYYFSGYVFEKNNPVSRKLYLHNRSTGELINVTMSSGNGYYYMKTSFSGSHYIVCLDDDAGTEYNDLIIGRAFPTLVT